MLRCVDFLFLKRAGMEKKKQENFLDYVPKRNKLYEWDWKAERADLTLYAADPIQLVALYMIRDDWVSEVAFPECVEALF